MTTTEFAARPADQWHAFWHGEIGEWILTRGLSIVLLLIGAGLAALGGFVPLLALRVLTVLNDNLLRWLVIGLGKRAAGTAGTALVLTIGTAGGDRTTPLRRRRRRQGQARPVPARRRTASRSHS